VSWKKLDSKSRGTFSIGSFSKRTVARYRIVMPATPRSAASTSSAVLVVAPHR
jgi:hypothetical protein